MENNEQKEYYAFGGAFVDKYKVPDFTKDRYKKWVNYGADNLYPQYLIDIFNKSAKHNAIVTGKVAFIYGKGIDDKDKSKLFKANRFETLNEVLKKLIVDRVLYDGYAIQVIWDKIGKNIAEIYHLDFSKVRSNESNTEFYFSNNWADYKPKFKVMKPFNPDNKVGDQIYYFRGYRPGLSTYPLPDYIGAIPYIECDAEIANYHRANLQNDFFFGGVLSFNNGTPTPEEKRAIVNGLKRRHGGTDNAGRWIINFSDGSDKAPTVTTLQPNELDKQFEILNKTVQEEIFVAHRVTSPMIFGIRTEGQLGGRAEIIDAYNLFEKNYVAPLQKHFEDLLTYFNEVNGENKEVKIEQLPMIKPQFSENVLLQIAAESEMREMQGLPPERPGPTAGQSAQAPQKEPVQKMRKDWENAIIEFSAVGESADDYDIFEEKAVQVFESDDAEADLFQFEQHLENDAQTMLQFDRINPTDNEREIIKVLKKKPESTNKTIAKEVGITIEEADTLLKKLEDEGILKLEDGQWNVLKVPPPVSIIDKIDEEIKQFEVKYRYTGPNDSKTRDFCKAMLGLNKVYTKDEISKIGKVVGHNVWMMRGGWYTIPGTEIHRPFCRHNWASVLVRKKKK